MSQCAHNKAIHLAAEGTVSVTDISQTQNITIVGLPDFVNNDYKIALYAKETKRYLCFNENWKLVGMQELQDTCYFNETIVHGYFVFRSVVDLQRRIGFTHRGKAIGPKKNVSNDACYMFTKIQADQFFHQNGAKIMAPTPSSVATLTLGGSTRTTMKTTSISKILTSTARTEKLKTRTTTIANRIKESRNKNINNRNKQNNNNNNNSSNNKFQNQSHSNGHNSNISYSNSNNKNNNNNKQSNLSQTKQQQSNNRHNNNYTREHIQKHHHQVRHHHNAPNSIARRQHHENKQKRRQHQQQRQHRSRVHESTTASLIIKTKTIPTTTTTIISSKPFTKATTTYRKATQTALGNAKLTARTTTSNDNSLTTSQTTATGALLSTINKLPNRHKGVGKRKIERSHKKHSNYKQRLLHKSQQQPKYLEQQKPTVISLKSTSKSTALLTPTITAGETANFDNDWSSGDNWWGNFTEEFNNTNSNNTNADYGSSEWLLLEPSPSSSLLSLSSVDVNEVSESDDSTNIFASTTSRYLEETNSALIQKHQDETSAIRDNSKLTSNPTIITHILQPTDSDSSASTDTLETSVFDNSWKSTAETTVVNTDFVDNYNASSESDENILNWSAATPILELTNKFLDNPLPTTAQTLNITELKALPKDHADIETTTSTYDNDNSTNDLADLFDKLTNTENTRNEHLLTSMSEEFSRPMIGISKNLPELESHPTLATFTKNNKQATTAYSKVMTDTTFTSTERSRQQNRPITKKFYRPGNRNLNGKIVHKFANAAATSYINEHATTAATTKISRPHKISIPYSLWSTTTIRPNVLKNVNNNKSNIIQINRNINNSLTDSAIYNKIKPLLISTPPGRSSFSTASTMSDKSLLKSTQKLLATPFHQLITYVRNNAGEIDIDNIDNISVYPEISDDSNLSEETENSSHTEANPVRRINSSSTAAASSRRMTIVSGYLPTSATAVLPESIQLAKIKINKERRRMLRQRRRHGNSSSSSNGR